MKYDFKLDEEEVDVNHCVCAHCEYYYECEQDDCNTIRKIEAVLKGKA